MHAALRDDDALPAELAEDESARVARHRGDGQAGDFLVGHGENGIDFIDQRAEAGTEHDAPLGLKIAHRLGQFDGFEGERLFHDSVAQFP